MNADSGGRSALGVGPRLLFRWHCGFESRWEHGLLSLVIVVCVVR
jgi:hypothetical protein